MDIKENLEAWFISFLTRKQNWERQEKRGAIVHEELAQELHKSVVKTFKRRKVFTRVKNNIWEGNLAEMGSLSFKNRDVEFLLCMIDIFTKYGWIKTLKDKTAQIVLHGFAEIVNKSKRKTNKLWVDQRK